CRVWNAETGDPLTPPLANLGPYDRVRFLEDGVHLLATGRSGQGLIWKLRVDSRPAEDLILLSQLLSGQLKPPSPVGPNNASPSLLQLWNQLRARYPSDFTVSIAEVTAWHESLAEQSERQKEWFAAAFHLEQLTQLRPTDLDLKARLDQARKNLQ
ncbi:MAG TPA: hypothetical protein VEC99_13315, partial [Clostridia bacterium]|nr:hypothetical protein [Clostridia bacterium]